MKDFYRAVEEGYTQWLAKAGQPYPYGSDMGSLADGKSIEQFAVLPPRRRSRRLRRWNRPWSPQSAINW